ncbi:MAG: hypothetical protein ACLR7D_08405 [Lachnospira eligens]
MIIPSIMQKAHFMIHRQQTYLYSQGEITEEEYEAILIMSNMNMKLRLTDNRFGSEIGKEFVAYIPAAAGIIMGRALGSSFFHTFMLSKMVILFTYVLVMHLCD